MVNTCGEIGLCTPPTEEKPSAENHSLTRLPIELAWTVKKKNKKKRQKIEVKV